MDRVGNRYVLGLRLIDMRRVVVALAVLATGCSASSSPSPSPRSLAARACKTLMTDPIYSAEAVKQAKRAASVDAHWAPLVPAFEELRRQSELQIGVGGPAALTADRLCREVGVPVRATSAPG